MKRSILLALFIISVFIVSGCSEEVVEPTVNTNDTNSAHGVVVHDQF